MAEDICGASGCTGSKRCEHEGCEALHANGCSADPRLDGWLCHRHQATADIETPEELAEHIVARVVGRRHWHRIEQDADHASVIRRIRERDAALLAEARLEIVQARVDRLRAHHRAQLQAILERVDAALRELDRGEVAGG